MSGWILSQGREAEQILGGPAPAGANSLALSGANAVFAAGQRLLISEADGAEPQWLGKITQVTDAAVTFSRPLKLAKSSGARLWRASAALELPATSVDCQRRIVDTGVATSRSAGGNWYALQIAQPVIELTLTLGEITQKLQNAVAAWIQTTTQWGLIPFTLIDPTGTLMMVVRAGAQPLKQEQPADDNAGDLTLTLTLAEEGSYQ